jgi:flagella basal body P-ring formation protein FlgA
MKIRAILLGGIAVVWVVGPAIAQSLVATRTIRANTVLTAADVAMNTVSIPGAASTLGDVVGLEARIVIYQGRPVRTADLGPPALIERNQAVVLRYRRGALVITAEGRALGRGGSGDRIRVMNIGSRNTVTGIVAFDGSVAVAP